jgi:hypothetical protein
MVVSLAAAWRVALAIAFCVAIFMSACARAPQRAVPGAELRRLVGGLASLTHHPMLAGLVYGAGIMVSALAAWLSRGRDQEDPPDGDDAPEDEQPPWGPDGVPRFDWRDFERAFRAYAHVHGQPSESQQQRV